MVLIDKIKTRIKSYCLRRLCIFTKRYEKNNLSNIKYHIAFKIGPNMLDVNAKCHGAPVTKCVTEVSIQ